MKTAFIIGILGQDGSYLSEILHTKGYKVIGLIRPYSKIEKEVKLQSSSHKSEYLIPVDLVDDRNYLNNLLNTYQPDEIYNFAGVSNVFSPFSDLKSNFEQTGLIPVNILEAIRRYSPATRYFQASSSLVFGRTIITPQNEETPKKPIHPYGAAKLYADNMIREYREVHNIFACSGIFYNHESPRRGVDFFTRKTAIAVANIKAGRQQKLQVGNLEAYRDMGYAPEYVHAAYLMLQNPSPIDYVIGSGESHPIKKFVETCFNIAGLDPTQYLEVDNKYIRTTDISHLTADISKIRKDLGWEPKTKMEEIAKIMVQKELDILFAK